MKGFAPEIRSKKWQGQAVCLLWSFLPTYIAGTSCGLPHLHEDAVIVNATKGIEDDTLLTMSGIWKEVLPKQARVQTLCLFRTLSPRK